MTRIYSDIEPDVAVPGRRLYREDGDYLVFGAWGYVPDDISQEAQYVMGAFARGNDPAHHNFRQSLAGLEGQATYSGHYGGFFVSAKPDDDEYLLTYHMDGDIRLTADFAGPSRGGSISGSVTGIRVGAVPYSGSLGLETANIGDTNSGFFEGRLRGSVAGIEYNGKWGGRFFGNWEAPGKPRSQPGSAAGTLGGRSEDGARSFVGGFGAHKQ